MRRLRLAVAAGALAVAGILATAAGGQNESGFVTAQDPMLIGMNGTDVQKVITVGETMPGGYRFESIPDGISLRARGRGRLDLFVNHETSTVPFPFTFPGSPNASVNQNDFDNAQVSHLVLNQHSKGVLSAKMAVASEQGFQRFCSNYLATEREDFDRSILLTNEEAIDWVNRSGKAWPATIGDDGARQAGAVLAYDVQTGKQTTIWGMGRHNHENSLAVPDYGKPVVLSGDDAFVNNPAQSQVYSYIADDTESLWNDEGDLYAFVADNPAINDYYDFAVGSPMSISGKFIKVPKDIATGRNPDGSDLIAADKGYPPPPNDGTWQRNPFVPQPGPGVDGPQWVLEHWSDLNNVFQFVRIEDMAYDKRTENVVYMADSGRAATTAGGSAFTSSNGRIWKLVLDPEDPTVVTSLSILVEGEDNPVASVDPVASFNEIHQPDNLETTAAGGLLVQEDPSTNNQYSLPAGPNKTTARIWKVDLTATNPDASKITVASVDQAADGGPTDVDGFANARLGVWESSGIVDASSVFGPGWFFVTVQAHSLWVERAIGEDNFAPFGLGNEDFTFKREGGQLLAIKIPGA
jgi:hypothetical protein